jgi:hypothetical protein
MTKICFITLLAAVTPVSLASLPFVHSEPTHPDTAQSIALATSRISAADLQKDLAILRQSLEVIHPGLYRYTTPADLAVRWDALNTFASQDRALTETFLTLSQFLATIKCGHTYTNFFNQPKEIAATLLQHNQHLPFHFRWIDRRMIVTHPFTTDSRLVRGSEILSINNTPSSEILTKLLTIARADGSNDAKRIRYLDITAGSRYEAFDVYFPLFFPSSSPDFTITFLPPNSSSPITITEKANTYAQRRAQAQQLATAPTANDAPLWTVTTLASDSHAPAALLTMPTWSVYNTKWNWLNTTMDSLAKSDTKTLIVDLRGNEGGNDCGNLIISYLITKDLTIANTQRFTRYQKTPADLNPYLDTWDNSFRDWGNQAQPIPTPPFVSSGNQAYFRLARYDDNPSGTVITASPNRYSGKVFILVDASCSSATFQFASLIQREKLATIVGEPTGGNQRGINGGAFFFLRLPHSKIEVDLPLIAAFPQDPNTPDAGLTPDILIPTTAADIASGNDPALQAVKTLLAK